MKILKFEQLNELSKGLITRASDLMASRGQNKRADNLIKSYNKVNYDFSPFIGKPLFEDEFAINIIIDKDRHGDKYTDVITIYVSNKKEFNTSHHQVTYYIDQDKWVGLPYKGRVSRKDARMLGKIAEVVNPDTKYKNGAGDIEIGEY